MRPSTQTIPSPTKPPADKISRAVVKSKQTGKANEVIRIEGDIPVDLTVADGDRFLFISKDYILVLRKLILSPAH